MKKLIALLLALCMLFALCACASETTNEPAGNEPAAEQPAKDEPAKADEPAEADAPADADEPAEADAPAEDIVMIGKSGLAINPDFSNPAVTAEPLVVPIATDEPEITFWDCSYLPAFYENDHANTDLYDWVHRWTGVNIIIHNNSFATATEQFNLMLVSGATDDIIMNMSGRYTKGGDNAIEEGMCLDLTDYVAKYMPNYQYMRACDDFHTRATVTDGGKLAYIYKMDWEQEVDWQGIGLRSDLVEELGKEMPVTYDDWTDVLTGIHETWGGWLSIPANGIFTNSEFASGFGIGTQWYAIDGKEVHYGAYEPEYKEYLALFADWYQKGLIDPDFAARSLDNRVTYGRQDCVGLSIAWGRQGPNIYLWNEAADYETDSFFLKGVPHAVKKAGDPCGHVAFKASTVRVGSAITSAAEDPVLCCKFLDYFYSEEGGTFCNYGPVGESCEFDENGNIRMTEAYNKEVQEKIDDGTFVESYSWEGLIYKHNWHENSFGVMDPARLLLQYDDLSAWEQCLVWYEAHLGDWNYPEGTQMTALENEEYAHIYNDASTIIAELSTKIIAGMIGLDEGYDEMIRQLDSINFQKCIELKQAALDRFYAR